jgi:hypothetical protein
MSGWRRSGAVLLFLLVIMMLPSVLANNYQIDIVPVNTTIDVGGTATYDLLINNFDNNFHRFQVYSFDPSWIVRTDPPISVVESRSQEKYLLSVKPTTSVGWGPKSATLSFKQLDADLIVKRQVIVNINDPNRREASYQPSVQLGLELPDIVNPRETTRVMVELRNRNPRNLSEMMVDISSPLFSKSYRSYLGPIEEKSEEFTFELDDYQAPGEYALQLILTYQNETVNELERTFSVERIENIQVNSRSSGSFFRDVHVLEIMNDGNDLDTYQAKIATNWFKRIFSRATPAANVEKIAGEEYYIWNLELNSREEVHVEVVENYRLLIILLVLLIAGVISYYMLRSPLIAVKEAILIKEGGDEGSNLKVRIFIKNRTGKQLDGVNVVDKVPSIATYVKKEMLGMASPTKVVTSERKGTVLKWELDLLEPYEERILTYSLTSKLKIVGKMKLPAAKVHFSSKGGRERLTYTKNVSYEE